MATEAWKLPDWVANMKYLGAFIFLAMAVVYLVVTVWSKGTLSKTSGKVVGIVGPMGSGKSYAAVRMALDRIRRGVDVVVNFAIDLDGLNAGRVHECQECHRSQRNQEGKPCVHKYLYRYKDGVERYERCGGDVVARAAQVRQFNGWDEFAWIRDAVVIVDEVHIWAPSHEHLYFPMIARKGLSDARKNGLDFYWMSQDENNVNKTILRLTNLIGVCESFFEGRLFKVTFYEPRNLRKYKRHVEKRRYRMHPEIADRYDTGAVMGVDEYALKRDESADKVRAVVEGATRER